MGDVDVGINGCCVERGEVVDGMGGVVNGTEREREREQDREQEGGHCWQVGRDRSLFVSNSCAPRFYL